MRTRICLFTSFLLCLIALTGLEQAAGKPKRKVRYSYLLYVPDSYKASRAAYPLIIYLHGGSQRGTDLTKLTQYGPPHAVEQGQKFNCLIASPQCPDGNYWSTDNWFDSLYAELRAKYRIDPKRVYLTGISMGGYGTWQTAVAYPNTLAAIAPLCGGCDDSTAVCRLRNVPVQTWHSADDDVIPVDETARLVRRLRACRGKVTFNKLEGKGHAIQYLYDERTLYDWLLRHHR